MKPTQKLLSELLKYNQETGELIWLERSLKHFGSIREVGRFNTLYAGEVAGKKDIRGYISIKINKKDYYAHRLIFVIMNGEYPKQQVDHIDGNGCNNSFKNLRLVSIRGNALNQSKPKNNTSGVVGVSFNNTTKKWTARIKSNYKAIHLGSFLNFNDAVNARKEAELSHGFHANHGRV